MTTTVDFLPFATGGGANVEDQASFAADGSTTDGFSSGIASSAKFNKVLRQASFVGAAIANWVSSVLNISVPDDGNLTNFVSNFSGALAATQQNGTFLYAAATGSANTLVAAPAVVTTAPRSVAVA